MSRCHHCSLHLQLPQVLKVIPLLVLSRHHSQNHPGHTEASTQVTKIRSEASPSRYLRHDRPRLTEAGNQLRHKHPEKSSSLQQVEWYKEHIMGPGTQDERSKSVAQTSRHNFRPSRYASKPRAASSKQLFGKCQKMSNKQVLSRWFFIIHVLKH